MALLVATASGVAPAEAADGAALRPALLEVTVNGQPSLMPVMFLQGPGGALYANEAAFEAWRIQPPAVEPVRFEGEKFYPINALTSLRINYSEAAQTVAIDVPASMFRTRVESLDGHDPGSMDRPSSGAFLNYDLFGEHVRGRTSVAGTFNAGVFTPRGVGETSFIASAGAGPEKVVRLETGWSIDRPRNATSIRIGDSISSGGPGGAPIRFGGLHYFRNYAVQPGFITMPLPIGRGSAAVPSIVDVYVNNALQSSRQVAPGPFELANIPVQTGGGTVQVVVRDLLGREIVSEQSYYASTQLLRRGLHDFSYEAGFVREDFGRRSDGYGALMASTTHRYGLSDRATLEGHAEASRSTQMASGAITMLAFDLGQVGASAAVSRSRDRGTGIRLAALFERRARNHAFGIRGEYSSENYAFIGMPNDFRPAQFTVQAFGDVSLGRFAVGGNVIHRALRNEADETVAGVFARMRVNSRASLQFFGRRVVGGRRDTVFGANLIVSLGMRRSASVLAEHGRAGARAAASYQYDPPSGEGGGYRLLANTGTVDSLEAAYVRNLPMATVQAQLGYSDGAAGVRLSASGSVGLIGRRLFAARRLGESFAEVRLDGYPGVRVYSDNQLVGVTDRHGKLIVPSLRAFDRNPIRIEDADLPLDVAIETNELEIRPYARTGTVIRFPIRRERGVLMQVRLADGTDLPAGARVSREGAGGSFVVASGGEVYVPDLAGTATMRAVWDGRSCSFTAVVPGGGDPQPRLDNLICTAPVYAAN